VAAVFGGKLFGGSVLPASASPVVISHLVPFYIYWMNQVNSDNEFVVTAPQK